MTITRSITATLASLLPLTALAEPPQADTTQTKAEQQAIADIPVPRQSQLNWFASDFGVMFHYDQRTFTKRYDQKNPKNLRKISHKPTKNPEEYLNSFHPDKLDTDQWIAATKAFGAQNAILVIKHEVGFSLFQSDANPWDLGYINWQGGQADILRDFVASCEKYGITPGIYISNRFNATVGVKSFQASKQAIMSQEEYDDMVAAELEELVTRYGDFSELWLDGGGGPQSERLAKIARKHQPDIAYFSTLSTDADVDYRGTLNEKSGTVPYPCYGTYDRSKGDSAQELQTGHPNGPEYIPARTCIPFRTKGNIHGWFWSPNSEHAIPSVEELQTRYLGSVGHNAKLIIGLAPNRDGLIPEADVERMTEFGDWLRTTLKSEPLASASGQGTSFKLTIPADKDKPVRYITLQEDIAHGERVRHFTIEAKDPNNNEWQQIYQGSVIGNKHIITLDQPSPARHYRLKIQESRATPQLKAIELR